MTILIEVQNWAEKLAVWQQRAVAVLYERSTPSADDLKDILALLQDSLEISDLIGRDASKRTKEQVAAPQAGQPLVQFTTIKNLQHLNAPAPGKTLPLALTGLTSIYGDNGADKVGLHPRIEEVCRERDQSEQIWPNATSTQQINCGPIFIPQS